MGKRGPKGPTSTSFKPGVSANPGGKPKDGEKRSTQTYLRDMCRERVPQAVEALMTALGGSDRVRAAEILCAYGYGRPVQTSIIRKVMDFSELADEELLALAQAADQGGEGVEISDVPRDGESVH